MSSNFPHPNYSQITGIDRRSNLSQADLMADYVNKRLPVIITDAASHWPAKGKLTPAWFKEHYPDITKTIDGVTYRMDEFIDRMLAAGPDNPAPYPYNFDIEKTFPALMSVFKPDLVYGGLDRINHSLMPRKFLQGTTVYEIFFGGNGSAFPYLHYDALFMNTQITQVYGSKVFYMYTPDQTQYMYPYPDNPKISQVNFLDPDYDKFPLFKNVRPIEITLQQGETLFFPSGWWHTTRITEPCITFGRAQLNSQNWDAFIKDRYVNWKKKISYAASGILVYGKIVGAVLDGIE